MTNWIIPCNPKNYDVIGAFEHLEQIDWKQSVKKIDAGDIVYIYVSKPYHKIMYKCVVIKTNLPFIGIDDSAFVKDGTPYLNYGTHMRLKKVSSLDCKGLDLWTLKEKGLRGNIQGPMRLSGELLKYIETIAMK